MKFKLFITLFRILKQGTIQGTYFESTTSENLMYG